MDQFSKWVQLVPVARYAKYIEAEEFNDKALKHHMHSHNFNYGMDFKEAQQEFVSIPVRKRKDVL